jgi:rSAM/selenodomain-associated transferase 1
MSEPVAIAILAKAPLAGLAKTRLAAQLGAERAALLAARLIERAVETASRSGVGPVTLWAAPDAAHPLFQTVRARHGLRLERQSEGDLGARMYAAMAAAKGPALVIGTDCPALTANDLQRAAETLRHNADAVIFPAEDGGYGLIGLRAPQRAVFEAIDWGTNRVLGETRRRFKELGLTWQEPVTLWDLDLPTDIDRLADLGLASFAQS